MLSSLTIGQRQDASAWWLISASGKHFVSYFRHKGASSLREGSRWYKRLIMAVSNRVFYNKRRQKSVVVLPERSPARLENKLLEGVDTRRKGRFITEFVWRFVLSAVQPWACTVALPSNETSLTAARPKLPYDTHGQLHCWVSIFPSACVRMP